MTGFDITDAVETLIEAAIACDITEGTDLLGYGSFYNDNGATGGRVVVPGRLGYSGAPDVHTSVADPATYPVKGTTAAAIYKKWEDRIYPMFYPYKTMPLPEGLDDCISGFEPLLQKLAINPEAFPNASSGKAEDLGFKVDGNGAFTVIGSVSNQFANFQGLTSEAFRTYFLDKFPIVTQRQYGIAQMLLGAVVGERLFWERMQHDVKTLVADATTAFDRRGGLGIDLTVVSTIISIASLVPALGAVTGPAGTIVGLLQQIPTNAPKSLTYDLKGSNAEEIWSSLEGARDKLNEAAAGQERDIGAHMDRIRARVTGEPGEFDIGRIDGDGDGVSESDEFGNATDASGVIGDKGVLQVEFDIMNAAGAKLKTVSKEFSAAAGLLQGLLSSGAWSRSGGIGSGYVGHFEQTSALADALVTALVDTAKGLYRGGEVVQLAAKRIQGEDEAADAALAKHAHEVYQVPAS